MRAVLFSLAYPTAFLFGLLGAVLILAECVGVD
jgi:hypothetical protein